jgi:hypothetical protein
MRFTVSAFLGLAILLCGNAAWAQSEDEGWQYFFFEEVLQRSCDDPTLQSAIALPQPKLLLETEDGKTKLKARIGMEMMKKYVLSLDVVSPTNSSGETTLASLNGLSKGTTVEGAFSWFLPPDIAPLADETDISEYSNPRVSRPSARATLGPKYKEVLEDYRVILKEKANFWGEIVPMVPVLSGKIHLEQTDFDFFLPSAGPPAGLKKTAESHMNHKLTGSLGGYFWGSVYASLNYARGTEFKAGATKDFCAPAGLAGVLQCETLVVAPPRKTQTEFLELEARGLAGNFGIGVHLTRDLRANVTTVELPVYFLQNLGTSKMEMNLGARAKWQSDTRAYSLSVFVGPALSTVLRLF